MFPISTHQFPQSFLKREEGSSSIGSSAAFLAASAVVSPSSGTGRKDGEPFFSSFHFRGSGSLSPPLSHPEEDGSNGKGAVILAGKYLLYPSSEKSHLHRAVILETQEESACKMMANSVSGRATLSAHYRIDGHPHINTISEVFISEKMIYLFFPPLSTDLHSYVRSKRRLREPQARFLFRQIVSAVHEAHRKGIVLRDLKLRKFVFTSSSRTELKLESLEDAVVLEDESDDLLFDKHGCPAYVSPEILKSNAQYSGRAADMWGLGVMLYTMLVGRYPFHGHEHTGLFAKIRRGQFHLPDSISSKAKCLIRCLLRKDPQERLSTEDVLIHPWLISNSISSGSRERTRRSGLDSLDQIVPENSNFD